MTGDFSPHIYPFPLRTRFVFVSFQRMLTTVFDSFASTRSHPTVPAVSRNAAIRRSTSPSLSRLLTPTPRVRDPEELHGHHARCELASCSPPCVAAPRVVVSAAEFSGLCEQGCIRAISSDKEA